MRTLYASHGVLVSARDAGHVSVDVTLETVSTALAALRRTAVESRGGATSPVAGAEEARGRTQARDALREAARALFADAFAAEFDKVVGAYRTMLRESLAIGDDRELQGALNRARLQEKLLSGTPMVDQAQACVLLGLSSANPSATMRRKEDKSEVLRFAVDGRAAYPLLQFDVEGRRIFPVVADLIRTKPKNWSAFRLLHWLTRPHLDFEGTPAEALGSQPDEVLAAFRLEVEPEVHG